MKRSDSVFRPALDIDQMALAKVYLEKLFKREVVWPVLAAAFFSATTALLLAFVVIVSPIP